MSPFTTDWIGWGGGRVQSSGLGRGIFPSNVKPTIHLVSLFNEENGLKIGIQPNDIYVHTNTFFIFRLH